LFNVLGGVLKDHVEDNGFFLFKVVLEMLLVKQVWSEGTQAKIIGLKKVAFSYEVRAY
jgi:hypothetical protein